MANNFVFVFYFYDSRLWSRFLTCASFKIHTESKQTKNFDHLAAKYLLNSKLIMLMAINRYQNGIQTQVKCHY